MTPKFLAKRASAAEHATEAPESARETDVPFEGIEPVLPIGEPSALESVDRHTSEREPVVLATALKRRVGGRLDR